MRFSSVELQHIGRAWLVVSLAFAVLLSDFPILSLGFLSVFGMAAFTVGLGFLLHELAHKWLAQRYGCRAYVLSSFWNSCFELQKSLFTS